MQLEEGEIESDGEGLDPYTPLERPDLGPGNLSPSRQEEVESDKKDSSSDNSDDEYMPKRPKLRRVNNPCKRNKYRVWCKDPNEHLTDFLDSFGMRNPENDRNVENYIVPNSIINERKRKVPKRRYSDDHEDLKPLEIKSLETSELNSFEEVAKDIAQKLSEPNYDLVLRIVIIIGKEKAIEFYNKTKEIEGDGGMLIANRSRRRTSGGVFILLVRTDRFITNNQKKEIFEMCKEQSTIKKSSQRKKQRKKKLDDWIAKMSEEKELESGQEEMNNPPPSPEPHVSDSLPELPLRRDLASYGDIHFTPSPSDHPGELSIRRDVVSYGDIHFTPSPSDHPAELPLRRDVVSYGDIHFTPSPSAHPAELPIRRDVVSYGDIHFTPSQSVHPAEVLNIQDDNLKQLSPSPQSSPKKGIQLPFKGEATAEEDDEGQSMELIYD